MDDESTPAMRRELLVELHKALGELLAGPDASSLPVRHYAPPDGVAEVADVAPPDPFRAVDPHVVRRSNMVGVWRPWYDEGRGAVRVYGPVDTYEAAEDWLSGLRVEDWGCGFAEFRKHHRGEYVGIDGTPGWADFVDDLVGWPSVHGRLKPAEGILLRHVLEHNPEWRHILSNAVGAFTRRLVVVVFTPDSGIAHKDTRVGEVPELGVTDLALSHQEIESYFGDCRIVRKRHFPTDTGYSGETVWFVEK